MSRANLRPRRRQFVDDGWMERVDLNGRENALREDLNKEYYALVDAVSQYDGRLLTIKGWSVTLSLAALGLGFQQQHYALFGLAAVTAFGFWYLDALNKRYQVSYYGRMRDIEVAAYQLNAVTLAGLGQVSAPRIDMSWNYRGRGHDWRTDAPQRRDARNISGLMHRAFVMPHVLLPHVVAIVLGAGLFVVAAMGAPWLAALEP